MRRKLFAIALVLFNIAGIMSICDSLKKDQMESRALYLIISQSPS